MKIKTDLGEYNVSWSKVGWSYAKVFIYQRRYLNLWLFKVPYNALVWEASNHTSYIQASVMLPVDQREWFTEAVGEYETYTKEWGKYNDK